MQPPVLPRPKRSIAVIVLKPYAAARSGHDALRGEPVDVKTFFLGEFFDRDRRFADRLFIARTDTKFFSKLLGRLAVLEAVQIPVQANEIAAVIVCLPVRPLAT